MSTYINCILHIWGLIFIVTFQASISDFIISKGLLQRVLFRYVRQTNISTPQQNLQIYGFIQKGPFVWGHLKGVIWRESFRFMGSFRFEAFRFIKASRIRGSFRFYESYVSTCNFEVVLIQQRKNFKYCISQTGKRECKAWKLNYYQTEIYF